VMGVLVAERSEVENCGWILEGWITDVRHSSFSDTQGSHMRPMNKGSL
jgi:hypothetical protein